MTNEVKNTESDESIELKNNSQHFCEWILVSNTDSSPSNDIASVEFKSEIKSDSDICSLTSNLTNSIEDIKTTKNDESASADKIYNQYISICLTNLSPLTQNNSDNNFTIFLKYNEFVKSHDYKLHKRCCVDGFRAAAMSNNLNILKHLYAENNVMTGNKRGFFEMPFKSSLGFKPRLKGEIHSDAFIISCDSNSIDVVAWMLKIETFEADVLEKAFKIVIKKDNSSGNENLLNIIFNEMSDRNIINVDWIEKIICEFSHNNYLHGLKWFCERYRNIFPKFIEQIFITSCVKCYSDTCRWVMNLICECVFPEFIASQPKYYMHSIILKGLKIAILDGSKYHELIVSEIINILIKYSEGNSLYSQSFMSNNPPTMFNTLYEKEINEIFVHALHKGFINTVTLMCGLKVYTVSIECVYNNDEKIVILNDTITNLLTRCDLIIDILTEIDANDKNSFEIISTISSISSKKSINLEKISLNIIMQAFLNNHMSLDTSSSNLSFIKRNFIIGKVQQFLSGFDKKDEKNNVSKKLVDKINIHVQTIRCITQDLLRSELKSSSIDSNMKEILAKLLGDHMGLDHKFDYKREIARELKLKTIKKNSDFVKTHIHSADECMMCIGECDMMLECGHIMCMCCALEWYIKKNECAICQFCRRDISLEQSYYLID